MNEIINKFLSTEDKFMPEIHLRQTGFTYSGPFTKDKKIIPKDPQYIYQNEIDKPCFQHDMAYGDFKDLTRRTVSDKILRDKAFNIAKNSKYDKYQEGLALTVYKCFNKNTAGGTVKNEIMQNKKLAEELHKPIIRIFEKRKVHSSL